MQSLYTIRGDDTREAQYDGDSYRRTLLRYEIKHKILDVYSQFRKFKAWFGIPIDRSLYRSLVSHEVAHFVADCNFNIFNPTIQAKEYIAYVTQFSTMESVLRERVLSQFPIDRKKV